MLSWLALSAGLLIAPGCGDTPVQASPAYAARSTGSFFLIGTPDHYKKPKVYTRFATEHGVFLVSAHRMLVALADTCPNPAHAVAIGVRYDDLAGVFRCPVCARTYTSDGLIVAPGTARPNALGEMPAGAVPPRSLDRCMIRPFGQIYDPQTPLQVDPSNRFRQDKNQWSEPGCLYLFKSDDPADPRNPRIGPIFE